MGEERRFERPVGYMMAVWLLVFASGWFIMLTELVSARVLSPYFGNTIYVWGSVIGIFLLAMAIGYAVGGNATRRFPSPLVPATLAGIAGIYVALTPFYQGALASWLYAIGMNVKWGALYATVILYGPPMLLLGCISPYAIHIAMETTSEAGSHAGNLYAISTIGSFLGCMVTAFVLIPSFSLFQIMFCGGIILTLISCVVALIFKGRSLYAMGLSVLLLAAMSMAFAHSNGNNWKPEMKAYQYPPKAIDLGGMGTSEIAEQLALAQKAASDEASKYGTDHRKVLLETETPYHHLLIQEVGPVRELIFGKAKFRSPQTRVDLRNLSWHVAEYTHMMFSGLLFKPKPKRVCVIGIGGAVVPTALERCFPGIQIDAVDIDPTVVQVAHDYFYWRPSRNVRIFGTDGRSFLNWAMTTGRPKYDWIVLDAYSDDYVPFHLTTREFAKLAREMLLPDGVLISNMCVTDDLYGCEARTYEQVFGNVTPFVGNRSGNVILTAQNGRKSAMTPDEAGIAARTLELPVGANVNPHDLVGCLREGRNWEKNGPVLTDTWAPVENLLKH